MNGELSDALSRIIVAAGSVAGGWMLARRKYSQSRVALAGDAADIGSIKRLLAMLDRAEQARQLAEQRADGFAEQRNKLAEQVGELKGQITALTEKVDYLTAELQRFQALRAPANCL